MNNSSSTIVQRLWNYCNVLRDERRLESMRAVESAVEAGLAPSCLPHFQGRKMGEEIAGRLRQAALPGEAMLRCAFEGRL